jgi:hypothetical protein
MSRDKVYGMSRIPDDLFSVLSKQLCFIMALAGLFCSLSILTKPDSSVPVAHDFYSCVNFRMFSPLTVNANIVSNGSVFVSDHVILGNDQQITIAFPVSESDLAKQISLAITGLVSRLNPFEGYSPIDVSINNRAFVTHFTMPGHGYDAQTTTFTIPADFLIVGKNTATIQVAPDARSYFWLYNVAVSNGTFQNNECKNTNFTAVVQQSLNESLVRLIRSAFSSLKDLLGFTDHARQQISTRGNPWHTRVYPFINRNGGVVSNYHRWAFNSNGGAAINHNNGYR